MSENYELKVSWSTDLSPTAVCRHVCMAAVTVSGTCRGGCTRGGVGRGYTGTQPGLAMTHI